VAQNKLDAIGIDAICAKIGERATMTDIAAEIGVGIGTLIAWIEADSERSARAREARARTARLWDEQATREIAAATDPFELAKAKELAHHYRWRAAKIAPRDYGEKIEHSGPGGGPVAVAVRFVDKSP